MSFMQSLAWAPKSLYNFGSRSLHSVGSGGMGLLKKGVSRFRGNKPKTEENASVKKLDRQDYEEMKQTIEMEKKALLKDVKKILGDLRSQISTRKELINKFDANCSSVKRLQKIKGTAKRYNKWQAFEDRGFKGELSIQEGIQIGLRNQINEASKNIQDLKQKNQECKTKIQEKNKKLLEIEEELSSLSALSNVSVVKEDDQTSRLEGIQEHFELISVESIKISETPPEIRNLLDEDIQVKNGLKEQEQEMKVQNKAFEKLGRIGNFHRIEVSTSEWDALEDLGDM